MKMMQKWMSRAMALLLALMLVGSILPTQASAVDTTKMPLLPVAAVNDNGETMKFGAGVPVLTEDGMMMFTDDSFYSSRYSYGTSFDGKPVWLEYESTACGMAIFSSSESSSVCMMLGDPQVGKTYTAVAADAELEDLHYFDVKIKGFDSDPLSTGWYALSVEHNVSSNCVSPVSIVDDQGCLIAIMTDQGVVAFVKPKGGFLSGKALYLAIGGVALAVLGVVIFLILRPKKNTYEGGADVIFDDDRTVIGGGAIGGGAIGGGGNIWQDIPNSTGMALVDNSGTLGGNTFQVPQKGMLIGRALEADVRYPADTKGVSRNHCRLYWEGPNLMVMDLGSKSGTYVLGKGQLRAHTPTSVNSGDVICLGSKKISLLVKKV